jgi:hypothetical protein
VRRDACDDERDAETVSPRGDLRQDDGADRRRGGRQERDGEGVGGPAQLPHRELVADVRDDRRGDADADARAERDGIE